MKPRGACFRSASHKRPGTLIALLSLLVFPSYAWAAQLSWEPPYVDFGAVPLSQTAYQTLTLTNEDPGVPISISGIEFTFNQGAAFTWSAAVPTEIPPGGFLEVQLSFTPTDADSSFYMADLWIYNDSDNASSPGLYIQLLGEVSLGDPCSPLANCDGFCVDLQVDPANCGSCFNACPVDPHGTSACETGSCSLTCEEGYEPVGDSCEPIVPQTALEMLRSLIVFVDEAVAEGTLVGVGPGASAETHLKDFVKALEIAEANLRLGTDHYADKACRALARWPRRSDGGVLFPPPPDWLDGDVTQLVHDEILDVMQAIAAEYPALACEPKPAITPSGNPP